MENKEKLRIKKVGVILFILTVIILGAGLIASIGFLLLTSLGVPIAFSALVVSQLSLLVVGLTFLDFRKENLLNILNKKITKETFFYGLKVAMYILIVNMLIGLFIKVPNKNTDTVDTLMNDVSFITSIILPVFVAPLVEELTFRAGLKYVLIDTYDFSKVFYIMFSSLLFSSLHFSGFNAMGAAQLLVTLGMGIISSIYYLKYDNIYIPIIGHLLYNGLIMITAYLSMTQI